MCRLLLRSSAVILALLALCDRAPAQQVKVEEFTLDNGMKFLLVPRTEQPNNIAAGWVAKVGSVNERPGITGISHFFEHMMFKGTHTIGTRDPKQEAELMEKERVIYEKILALIWNQQYQRMRNGEIDDPWNPANDTPEIRELRGQLKQLMDEHSKLIVKNEYDSIYTGLGGSGINATTGNDLTFYFLNVPSNKFELWAWMESDRLADSVFREFYSERDVVHEERRLRTESTPTGVFQEQFDAMFWQSSPYSWPVIGWTSDLFSYTRDQADRYFNIYYRPNNLVGVIVGDFVPAQVKPTIQEYFGRLKRGEEPPPVVTLEMPQTVEKRMTSECDCQPQVEVRYHTVAFNHPDSFPLEIMAQLLNGRTGRLYKSMIEGKKIASSAQATSMQFGGPAKYAGFFSFEAEVKGDATPDQLERAWYEELDKLQKQAVPERELQKVKNQVAANAFRRVQNNFFLMLQLGYFEGLGRWQYINEAPVKLQAVTVEDVQRVANKYFDWSNRSVAIYVRKAGTGGADDELAKFTPQQRGMIKQLLGELEKYNLTDLQNALAKLQSQSAQVPPQWADAFKYVVNKTRERIAQMEAEQKK